MLAAPVLVGLFLGGASWVHLPLVATWFLGYFAFFAASLWLRSGRRDRYLPPVRAYTAAAGATGAVVLVLRSDLVRWLPVFAPLLLLGLWFAARRQDRSLPSGLVMIVAACLMTPVAYDAGGGADWGRTWTATAVLAAYFVGTLLYVKTMIRERGSRAHYRLSVGYHAVVTAASWWVSWGLTAFFLLLTVRAAVLPGRGLAPPQVGMIEILATGTVVVLALLVG